MTKMREPQRIFRRFDPTVTERKGKNDDALPDGICGRIAGRACQYNTPDDYNTMFAPGCFDTTRDQKVSKGQVQLFLDHDHTTHAHVGVVREIPDVGNALMMYAECFDNDYGRAALDYCKTVLSANAFTGLSVGGFVRSAEPRPDPTAPGKQIYTFTDFELAEISLTPVPAVPGTEVMHARRTPEQQARGLEIALEVVLTSLPRRAALDVLKRFGYGELAAEQTLADAAGLPADTAVRAAASVPFADRLAYVRANLPRLNGKL